MSLTPLIPSQTLESFPRVSGDEPTCQLDLRASVAFSPRERG